MFGLHVHVAVRGADRALAVHNALRSHLPDLAALAGNAPLHGGRDTGLASLRPKLCDLLPRQGVPPAWRSWEERADYERWGRRGGVFPGAGEPWYELRAHDELGTIELRVPDTQSTPEEAAGVLAFAAALVAWLAERYDAGETLPVHDHSRIAENRWRAMRHGLDGTLLDLDSGEPAPARARILALIERRRPGGGAPRRRRRARARAHARRPQRRRAPARAGRRARRRAASSSGSRTRSCHEGQRRHSDFGRVAVGRIRSDRGCSAGVTLAKEPLSLLDNYPRPARGYDEAVDDDGSIRAAAEGAMRALTGHDLEELAVAVERHGADEGVVFHSEVGDEVFVIDPVPRVIAAAEWARVEAGLAQRVRALNAFVADVYAERRIVAEGVVPARVIDSAEYLEPGMQGVEPPGGLWIGVAGLDLVRDADGRFHVLEDNVRTPSGFAYAVAARRALVAHLEVAPSDHPRKLDGLPEMLWGTLHAAAPTEHAARAVGAHRRRAQPGLLRAPVGGARQLGVPLVEPEQLDLDAVDVVYRRTNADRLDTGVGELLLEPIRAGRIGVVNAFGTGVADDKLTHAYVEDMIRFYEDEEPILPSVETFDLGRPEILERALDVFDELVIKPRGGYGGVGVAVLPHANREDREQRARGGARSARGLRRPAHGDDLDAPDRDRRPARAAPRRPPPLRLPGRATATSATLPGGLTRVAFDEGSLVVNSSQNGGAKDTWVLP